MTWSYDISLSADKDKVRFNVGDTDSTEELLQDEEITYLLVDNSVLGASIAAAENIAAMFSRLMDENVGDVKISYSQRAEAYWKMVDKLKRKFSISSSAPIAPAISITSKEVAEADTDRVKPSFTIGMDDFDGQVIPDDDS